MEAFQARTVSITMEVRWLSMSLCSLSDEYKQTLLIKGFMDELPEQGSSDFTIANMLCILRKCKVRFILLKKLHLRDG